MFRLDADKRVHFCDGVTRRDFLHAGTIGMLGLSLPEFFSIKAAGNIKLEGTEIEVSASAKLTLKGATVDIN